MVNDGMASPARRNSERRKGKVSGYGSPRRAMPNSKRERPYPPYFEIHVPCMRVARIG